ncbi:hypothetical protein ACFLR4_00965 [Bacteroidota bacterium]
MTRLSIICLYVSIAFSLQIFAQQDSVYLKVHKFNNTTILVKQNKLYYPRVCSLEINHMNMIISKEISSGDPNIEDSWVTDLDEDKNPEIIVFQRTSGSGGYGELKFYELVGKELEAYKLPNLNSRIDKFYRGRDNFSIIDNYIEHSFPAYNDSDANCCPTGGKIIIKYELKHDKLVDVFFEIQKNNQELTETNPRLVIYVNAALGLPKLDSFSKTDCWLEIFIGEKSIGRTKKIENENSPYFNEMFEYNDYSNQYIKIVAYDQDVTKNEYIGEVIIEKPVTGKYPLLLESNDGSIISRGKIDIAFEKK